MDRVKTFSEQVQELSRMQGLSSETKILLLKAGIQHEREQIRKKKNAQTAVKKMKFKFYSNN